MPKLIVGVDVTDNLDGTASVQIGPFGYSVRITDLFAQTLDPESVKANCRLAYLVGGYSDPTSNEFIVGVNRTNKGMETRVGNITILSVVQVDPAPVYEVTFKINSGPQRGQTFGISMTLREFQTDVQDDQAVIANLSSFLRVGGFTSLTALAVTAIKAWPFRY